VNPLSETCGNYLGGVEWISQFVEYAAAFAKGSLVPHVTRQSATASSDRGIDIIVTAPPYYDAIPYSDLMDFFYVWLRRVTHGFSDEMGEAFAERLSPKWNHETSDGELIDDAARHGGDKALSKPLVGLVQALLVGQLRIR
jgi:adenine-specific DNA methylase